MKNLNMTFTGNSVTLPGKQLKKGDKMPQFTVRNNDLKEIKFSDTEGLRLFVAVPSLDTTVCDMEVRTFNEKLDKLNKAKIWVVSMDLPFAQMRWCGATGIDSVHTVSDYKDHSFAEATGTYVKELGLLTRAVFIVDSNGVVQYAEYVPEITDPPNYQDIYKEIVKYS